MQNLAVTYPETNKGNGSTVGSLKERVVGDIRGTLWLLLGAVGFVVADCLRQRRQSNARAGDRSPARIRHPRGHSAPVGGGWCGNLSLRACSWPRPVAPSG
jgi:hypothetical protein